MMILGAIPIPSKTILPFVPNKPHSSFPLCCCRASSPDQKPLSLSTRLKYVGSTLGGDSEDGRRADPEDGGAAGVVGDPEEMVASAFAVAALIRTVSTSPVEFVQTTERTAGDAGDRGLVLPSVDFQRLCLEQLQLFRRIVHPDAFLSVYVRPAGSYVMDRLEMRRIAYYPDDKDDNAADIVILVGTFSISAGLRAAEAALSSRHAELFPKLRSVVFPLVKHPFVVGFLVAEFSQMITEGGEPPPFPAQSCFFPSPTDSKLIELQTDSGKAAKTFNLMTEQRLNAVNISRSLAMAYVMDQKAMLLQQTSWQNNVRMSSLIEQIRGSLSSIRTLSKMLSVQMKRSEIAFDIVEDILVQGDHMQDIIDQLQDAVYLTKANIIPKNGGKLKKMHEPTRGYSNSKYQKLEPHEAFSLASTSDSEAPMPPLALAPLQQKAIRRPCYVSDVLNDLVAAVEPLAHMQQRHLRVSELSRPSQVSVDELALRQALSNLIEGALLRTQAGGSVEIVSTGAPAGGALVIIDDDGPDMHYMTQTHSLTPFGMELFAEGKVEDNMTWNFVAGLTVAREILESYGCVVRVISPRITNADTGARGTRVELWLPYCTSPAGEFGDAMVE